MVLSSGDDREIMWATVNELVSTSVVVIMRNDFRVEFREEEIRPIALSQ